MENRKDLVKYIGTKFFKQNGDDIKIVRLVKLNTAGKGEYVQVYDEDSKKVKSIKVDDLKDFTPLESFGLIGFAKVLVGNPNDPKNALRDVIVTLYRMKDIEVDINEPYAICRQGAVDKYALIEDPYSTLAGTCVNKFEVDMNTFRTLAACDKVLKFEMVNFYLDDDLDSILNCIDTTPYDDALREELNKHERSKGNLFGTKKKSDDGWCNSLQVLLEENDFMAQVDELRNVMAVNFKVEDYLTKDKDGADHFNNKVLDFLRECKVYAKDTLVLKYWYDIDLADFNNTNYFFIRDITNTTYIVNYLLDNQYREADLIKEKTEVNDIHKLSLNYYNKYTNKKS